MLSVGDGIAIGGFIIVVAQFVLAHNKNKSEKSSRPENSDREYASVDELFVAQFNVLDKKVAVFESESKHLNNRLVSIEHTMNKQAAESRRTEALLFKKIEQLLVKIDSLRKG